MSRTDRQRQAGNLTLCGVLGLACVLAGGAAARPSLAADAPAGPTSRVARVNQAFLKHLETLGREQALAVATIRDGWNTTYSGDGAESFVSDALAVLHPTYRAALEAFDAGRSDEAVRHLTPLLSSDDAYLATGAAYFWSRAMADLGRLEELEKQLSAVVGDAARLDATTAYAPHLSFVRAYAQARNLRVQEAREALAALRDRYPDAPESILTGARQLLIELERREVGTLGEVSSLMRYAADRLSASDATQRVRQRQDEAVALLDKLIKELEDQEKSGAGGGSCKKGGAKEGKGKQPSAPSAPRDDSVAPEGSGETGDLHAAPKAAPGEMWGKLPPSEREKILQTLRDRFPSRYRQLVEQYYRSLAEQK